MKRGLRLAEVLDSRGLVHYRRGEFRDAISDYDAALKAQPNLAWSRLGRGLARLKTGDLAGGRADIAAAEALQPGIRQKAEGYGLAVPADAGVMSTS
jgi:tetratricopeptide (TPR) repeat protein